MQYNTVIKLNNYRTSSRTALRPHPYLNHNYRTQELPQPDYSLSSHSSTEVTPYSYPHTLYRMQTRR